MVRPTKRVKYLREAMDLGFDDADQVAQDSDFDSIREDDRYLELLAELDAEDEDEIEDMDDLDDDEMDEEDSDVDGV